MDAYSPDLVLRLIGLIYEAATAPELWASFLDCLAATIDAHMVNLAQIDPATSQLCFLATARCDPAALSDYQAHYAAVDPWVSAARQQAGFRPGLLDLGERYVSPATLKRTEFYNDFGRRFEVVGGISALFEAEGALLGLSLTQHKFGQFSERELGLMRTLIPHVKRAVGVHRRLESAERAARSHAAALDALITAIVFVSETGKVVHANRSAQQLLRRKDGLLVDRSQLRASAPSETLALRRAIDSAVRLATGGMGEPPPKLFISRPSGGRPLSVAVAPLNGTEAATIGPRSARVGVFIADPERVCVPDRDEIRRLLRVTPAEADLLRLLACGHTLEESALRLGVAIETVRKRLKSIFAKTETHRQADLVRLVLTGNPPI